MPAKKKNDGEPKRVVFYIRFSSWKQDAENSKEGQLNALQDYADSNGKICVGIYIEEAISGKRDDRMELNRLMRDGQSRDRPFDEVLIWKFDRFGRRASTIDRRATDLESLGIAVTAIQQPIDGKPAVVRFVRNLLGNISEYFSDNMGEDIARGRKTSAGHGVWTNSSVPFGLMREYRMDRGRMRPFLVPDPKTAWIIVQLFGMYLDGTGTSKIAKTFRDEGVPNSSDKPWTPGLVRKRIKNIAYAGFVHYGKRSKFDDLEVLAPWAEMELIILEEYNRAQEIMASRTPKENHPREIASVHILSGLVYCDKGNYKMSPTGGERSYYNCNGRRAGICPSCDTPNPRAEHLDAAVLEHVINRILIEENTGRIIAIVAKSQTETTMAVEEELKNVSMEIENQKEYRNNLLRLVETGGAVPTDISERLDEIRATLTQLESNALKAKAKLSNEKALTSNPQKVAAYAKNLDTYLRGTNLDLTKQILNELITEIRIRPGEEKDTATVIIRYRIPMPPKGWTEKADVEELLFTKGMHSLDSPVHSGDAPLLLSPGLEGVFFEPEPYRLVGQRRHQSQFHHLVGQQPQGPVVMALGRVAARQGNQVGFASIIQLAIPIGLRMVVQHAVQSFLPIPSFGAEHRARRRVQGHRHLRSAPPVVSLEQDARPIDDPSRALTATDQPIQLGLIFRRQPYRIFLRNHGCRTSPTAV